MYQKVNSLLNELTEVSLPILKDVRDKVNDYKIDKNRVYYLDLSGKLLERSIDRQSMIISRFLQYIKKGDLSEEYHGKLIKMSEKTSFIMTELIKNLLDILNKNKDYLSYSQIISNYVFGYLAFLDSLDMIIESLNK